MKNFKSLLLIAVFTLSVIGVTNAQKIGHVDIRRVLNNMSESRALESNLQKIAKTSKDEIDGLRKDYFNKRNKYQAEAEKQTEDTNKKRAQELASDEAKINQALKFAQQDIAEREAKGMAPIEKKLRKALEEVADSKGIIYVFDASSLLIKKGEDLYDDLKVKLNLLKDRPKPKQPQGN